MTIAIGSIVRVKPPFDEAFPGEWEVNGQNEANGAWQIDGGADFDEVWLEEVIE